MFRNLLNFYIHSLQLDTCMVGEVRNHGESTARRKVISEKSFNPIYEYRASRELMQAIRETLFINLVLFTNKSAAKGCEVKNLAPKSCQ